MQPAKTTLVKLLVTGLGLLILTLTGCGVPCQQPGQTLTTITNQEFRLVSSTDPTLNTVTNTNFITMLFNANYTGQVYKVQNNNRFNNPALVFSYNIDPTQNQLKLQYSEPPATDSSGSDPSTTSTGATVGNPKTYTYTLDTGLTLTDTTSGYQYVFVPFEGIVLPDQQCTF